MTTKNMNRMLAVTGALGALTILLGITRLGILPWFSGASITILHLPVIIGAILEGPVAGCIIAVIFGVFSLIQAVIAPAGALDPYFVNPLVSVVPRLAIALCSWLVFAGLTKIRSFPKLLAVSIAACLGSLANTAFVLGSLVLVGALNWQFFVTVFTVNGLPEAAGAVIICTPVCAAWLRIGSRAKSRINSGEK